MSGSLLALALRCETLTAPSRLLDFEIHIAAVEDAVWPVIERNARVSNPNSRMSDYLSVYRDVIDADDQDFEFPRYTRSIDAAVALMPCGWTWGHLQRCDRQPEFAALLRPNLDGKGSRNFWTEYVIGRAKTPALAMCAAALRATPLSDTPCPEDGQ